MRYKALFAIAAALDLEIEQMDVTTAFLYGDIDGTVYVEQLMAVRMAPSEVQPRSVLSGDEG